MQLPTSAREREAPLLHRIKNSEILVLRHRHKVALIVTPRTLLRWHADLVHRHGTVRGGRQDGRAPDR